jgi:hypothetical protein
LTTSLVERAGVQGKTNPVEDEPGGLPGDADGTVQFDGTHAIAGTGGEPKRRKPRVQARRRILEDRPGLDAELLFAWPTRPHIPG